MVDPKDIYLMLEIQFYEVHKSYFKFKVRRLEVSISPDWIKIILAQ
jgi:hypothetical protein